MRWVRAEDAQQDDVRLSCVIRRVREPQLHAALARLHVRGGYAALVRTLLQRALLSGELDELVRQLNAGSAATGALGTAAAPAAASALHDEVVQRMRQLNRF